jgi:hypothetical protein
MKDEQRENFAELRRNNKVNTILLVLTQDQDRIGCDRGKGCCEEEEAGFAI